MLNHGEMFQLTGLGNSHSALKSVVPPMNVFLYGLFCFYFKKEKEEKNVFLEC